MIQRIKPNFLLIAAFLCGCAAGEGAKPARPEVSEKAPPTQATPPPAPQPFISTNIASSRSPSDFRATIEENLRITQEEPRNFNAYMKLGEAYHHLKQLGQAEKAFENASLVNPDRVEPMLKLALVCIDSGKYEKAVDIYRELLRRDPKNTNLQNNLATAYRKKRDYTSAFKIIRELLNADKRNVYAINNLGLIYLETGRNELAELTFQKGKKINASTAETYNNLGLTYLAMDLPKNAITEFKKAAELNSDLVESRLNLGDLYLNYGNYTLASTSYQEVLKVDPLNLQANQNIGACYIAMKKPENALLAYNIIAEIDPNNRDALYNLGLLYQDELSNVDQALRYFRKYISVAKVDLKPSDPVFNYVAQLEQTKKRQERAAQTPAPKPAPKTGGVKK